MAAIILLSQLYNRPVHICHVAKREEVGVANYKSSVAEGYLTLNVNLCV